MPKARVLARSVKHHYQACIFHLVLVDTIPEAFDLTAEPFDSLLTIQDLDIRRPEQWLFQHSVVEACTGVKGPALKNLLSRDDCTGVLYFDPDIVVLGSLDGLLAELAQHDILVTPHLTEPETTETAILDNEFSVLRHGIYNLGFVGVKASEEGRRFAEWWAHRLENYCFDDIPRGLFTDQRWVDLAPAYFPGLHVLHEPGYNVCTWNLTHREVSGNFTDGFTANGRPLCFYHFSGFDSGSQKAMLDKYGSRMPALYDLRDWYVASCDEAGQQEWGNVAWSYDCFDNGAPIQKFHRKCYQERVDLQKAFPNPYLTSNVDKSYYHWFEVNAEHPREADPHAPSSVSAASWRERPPRLVPAASDPEYRIFLAVLDTPTSARIASISVLLKNSYRSESVWLTGPASAIQAVQTSAGPFAGLHELPAGASYEDAFASVSASSSGDWDFILVSSGTGVPELWDLRLAWAADRRPGVATASPLNGECLAENPDDEITRLDRVGYESSLMVEPEGDRFFSSCFYVTRTAISDALAAANGSLTFKQFSDVCRRLRWSHVTTDHVYTCGGAGEGTPLADNAALETGHPAVSIRQRAARRQLHVLHSWGGGLDRWVQEYAQNDRHHDNLLLRSVGTWGAFGQELHLYRRGSDSAPIERWALSPAVKHTAVTHARYQAALAEIVDRYGIDAVLISSLVGHSLDLLDTGLPTVLVCHDYYPYCPALNITFDGLCNECTPQRLRACTEENPHNRFFRNVPPSEWVPLRKAFADRVLRSHVPMIAPSPSVRENYTRLVPELESRFQIIPHGLRSFETAPLKPANGRRLRIVVLGSLSPNKGGALLLEIAEQIAEFGDLCLIGCGDYGDAFEQVPNVTIIPSYDRSELPRLLAPLRPDVGLLPSVVPETFSFTLHELMELGVPPVVTRLGSFADTVQDDVSGFLCDPTPAGVLSCLRQVAGNRQRIASVRRQLATRPRRSVAHMIADYEALLALPDVSSRAYYNPIEVPRQAAMPPVAVVAPAPVGARQVNVERILQQLSQAKARVDDLEHSLSWRWTKPLRWLAGRYLSIRRGM